MTRSTRSLRRFMPVILGALAVAGCSQDETTSARPASRQDDAAPATRLAATQIHCPAPETIKSTRVPTSFNAIYYGQAEEGVAFDGFDMAGLDPTSMRLVEASVAVTGGVWRLYCGYFGTATGQHLSLASEGSSRWQSCSFPGGGTSCRGSQPSCVFVCVGSSPPT